MEQIQVTREEVRDWLKEHRADKIYEPYNCNWCLGAQWLSHVRGELSWCSGGLEEFPWWFRYTAMGWIPIGNKGAYRQYTFGAALKRLNEADEVLGRSANTYDAKSAKEWEASCYHEQK